MTAPAMAALALRFRCPVIPGHVQRIGPARFRLVCEPPIVLPDTGDRQADVLAHDAGGERLPGTLDPRPAGKLAVDAPPVAEGALPLRRRLALPRCRATLVR